MTPKRTAPIVAAPENSSFAARQRERLEHEAIHGRQPRRRSSTRAGTDVEPAPITIIDNTERTDRVRTLPTN